MYLSCAAWQVTPIDALTLPLVAVIVAEPFMVAPAVQVTRPVDDTVATLATLELHCTVFVMNLRRSRRNNCPSPPIAPCPPSAA